MTKRQRELLQILNNGYKHVEADLGTNFSTIQLMYLEGWINGAFTRNLGRTPRDRVWWITDAGRKVLGEPVEASGGTGV